MEQNILNSAIRKIMTFTPLSFFLEPGVKIDLVLILVCLTSFVQLFAYVTIFYT